MVGKMNDTNTGQSNAETSTIKRWLTTQPQLFPSFGQPGINAYRAAGKDLERATRILADDMKNTIKTKSKDIALEGLWRELLDAAIDEADWNEIAAAVMVDVIDAVENY